MAKPKTAKKAAPASRQAPTKRAVAGAKAALDQLAAFLGGA
jgi:hypothetical protein